MIEEVSVIVLRQAETMLFGEGEESFPMVVIAKRDSLEAGLPAAEATALPGVGGVVRGRATGVVADGVVGAGGRGVLGAGVDGAGVDDAGVLGAVERLPLSGVSTARPVKMPDILGNIGPLGFIIIPEGSS